MEFTVENEEIKKQLLQRFEQVFDQYLKVTDADVEEIYSRGVLSKNAIYDMMFHTLCEHIVNYKTSEIK